MCSVLLLFVWCVVGVVCVVEFDRLGVVCPVVCVCVWSVCMVCCALLCVGLVC